MKNILVLSTLDEIGDGHARSEVKIFESLGFNVAFVPLIRTDKNIKTFIIDSINKNNLRYRMMQLSRILEKIIFLPFRNARFQYKGDTYTNASEILSKCSFNPDYIYIGGHMRYLSPKTICSLYRKTKAVIIISMVDAQLLGGGCYYPLECRQYQTGCKQCPNFPIAKFIPRHIYKSKLKYFSRIPLHIIGTPYDIERAANVPFLKDKIMHPAVGVPSILFEMSKDEAREKFHLEKSDFIIMAGAVNLNDKRKGFDELITSLKIFSKSINDSRKVTLLVMSKKAINLELPENIKICNLGFLSKKDLFCAFYACDVFASSSWDDSGPYMVNYSIACGRPVVAFPIGIAKTLVVHKKTGFLAEYRNSISYSEGLHFFYEISPMKFEIFSYYCKSQLSLYKKNTLDDIITLKK